MSTDTPRMPAGPGSRDSRSEEQPATSASSARSAPQPSPAERLGADGPARKSAVRRGPADPVKALMHRHRELCERAVDPLEIAAGLEAHGVTDRTAARFRHRDVFSLADELYARVPRADAPERAPEPPGRGAWSALALLPGATCVLAVAAVQATDGQARVAAGAAGALALAVALRLCLRRGPLRAEGRTVPAARLWVGLLLAYALFGDGLLTYYVGDGSGGSGGHWRVSPAPVAGLALAVAPAAWCAGLFGLQARRRLTTSRALEEFAGVVRPLLLGVFALFLCGLTALLLLSRLAFGEGALLAPAALGALLFLARLLTVHGFPDAAATGLGAACAAEAAALTSVLAGRLPGCGFLAGPVEAAQRAWGPASVPAAICATAAVALLVHATVALSRASAHSPARTG
ncbi:hypothetical protein [Streptomyces sp. NPDC051219]|uniref:hypothetical protein n=1 Tax=Streptomyces sp. NPDC051219 TaxID=3155283 RepID=UPI003433C211